MNAGDIVFIKGKTFISKIILWFDPGEFTHVAIATSATCVIEAQRFAVVRLVPMTNEERVLPDMIFTPEQRADILVEAGNMLGMRYDYFQILGYLFMKLLGKRGSGRFNSPNRLVCSELVSRALYGAGIIDEIDDLYDLTPNELYDYLTYLGKQGRSS